MNRWHVLFLLAPLAGCSLTPRDSRPPLPVPPNWPDAEVSAKPLPEVIAYQDIFQDQRLQRIVAQALDNNRDLRAAAANIAAARARYRIERAGLMPQVDAAAGTSVRSDRPHENYGAEVAITSFEIDLFGRLRALSDAALEEYFATAAAARATRIALIGDIASAWLTYAADSSLLAIAERTAANAERSVKLTRARLEGGIAPRSDLRQAETIWAQARSDVAAGRTAVAQDVNLLQLLAGGPIDPLLLPGEIAEAGQSVADLPAGIASSVLLDRPDVMQAEHALAAANARIGAARAALFPRISLTGIAGYASKALGSLFTDGAFTATASPEVSQSIFAGGARAAGVKEARANRAAALARYEGAIQSAFREVADALARRRTIGDQLAADSDRVVASEDAWRLADARYRGGIDAYLLALDAQRSLYAAERTLVATRLEHAINRVTLFRVLGGDARQEDALLR